MKTKRAGNYSWLFLSVLLFCLIALGSTSVEAAKIKIPKSKIGATHHTHNTGDFKLDELGSSETGSESGSLVGLALFYERLFLDRFSAGFKYGYGLERSMDMRVGTSDLEVLERASFWAWEFRAFVKDNIRPGMKPYLGVSFGRYIVESVINILPDTGTATQEETSATIPFTMLAFGADYTFGFGGIRLELGQVTGKRNDLEGSETYHASYDYNGSVIGISVYSFF